VGVGEFLEGREEAVHEEVLFDLVDEVEEVLGEVFLFLDGALVDEELDFGVGLGLLLVCLLGGRKRFVLVNK
jgi:hypothetical protein